MTEPWTPLCLVAACDEGLADWPLPRVLVAPDAPPPRPWAELLPQVAAAVALTEAGAAALAGVPGLSLPILRATPETVAAALAGALALSLAQSQSRVIRQQREIGQMRQMAETMLRDFDRLEAFVWATGKGERQPVHSLAPLAPMPAGKRISQRLPGDSLGLCDVAVHGSGGKGVLTARLILMESAEVVGVWQLQDPEPGWLRLGLPRALGGAPQTPVLQLDWQGEGLTLDRTLDHPDDRFRCEGGAMLALRLWKFVPGTAVPLAPEAWAPEASGRGRWLIGPLALAEAALGLPGFEPVAGAGLVARLAAGQAVTLTLPGVLRPGMRRLLAAVSVAGAPATVALSGAAPQTVTEAQPATLGASLDPVAPCDLTLTLTAEAPTSVFLDRIDILARSQDV